MKYALWVVAFFLCGCASQIMKSYIGKDIREVVVDYGQPQNALDMGDGRRAFQWIMTKSRTTPVVVSTSGTSTTSSAINGTVTGTLNNSYVRAKANSTTWLNSNTQITGGETIVSECVYTLFATWNEASKSWQVVGFREPRFTCE